MYPLPLSLSYLITHSLTMYSLLIHYVIHPPTHSHSLSLSPLSLSLPLPLFLQQPLQETNHTAEINIAQAISPHLNLSHIRGLLPQAPADFADFLPESVSFVVHDLCPESNQLSTVIPQWRASLNADEYEECVLMTMLQVLRGLQYLYCNGIVHRDLCLDSLHAQTNDMDTIIKIVNFQYALHRSGPLSATTFIYTYSELQWLGGAESRLPPEIMDTPDNAHTLDYAHTDAFATGCLIYDLMTGANPFDTDSKLVYSRYDDKDLPDFPTNTQISMHLKHLAQMLLCRDPKRRLGISDALLLVQAMLWLPEVWLEAPTSTSDIENHLMLMKASVLAGYAAQSHAKKKIPLEILLKTEFISSCNVSDLVRTLAVFWS